MADPAPGRAATCDGEPGRGGHRPGPRRRRPRSRSRAGRRRTGPARRPGRGCRARSAATRVPTTAATERTRPSRLGRIFRYLVVAASIGHRGRGRHARGMTDPTPAPFRCVPFPLPGRAAATVVVPPTGARPAALGRRPAAVARRGRRHAAGLPHPRRRRRPRAAGPLRRRGPVPHGRRADRCGARRGHGRAGRPGGHDERLAAVPVLRRAGQQGLVDRAVGGRHAGRAVRRAAAPARAGRPAGRGQGPGGPGGRGRLAGLGLRAPAGRARRRGPDVDPATSTSADGIDWRSHGTVLAARPGRGMPAAPG